MEAVGVEAASRVAVQPLNGDAFIGAKNRALALKEEGEADYFVGIEGGLLEASGVWYSFGSVCISNQQGKLSWGMSPHFQLPPRILERILKGEEMGAVFDEVMGEANIKQKQGGIGVLSKGVMERRELYRYGVVMALLPFVNPLYH